ncbi:MAG TPA: TIGR03621 family F420-dependent LLM class oxidoreductase [Actinocrinis sp.]|jgi:probable F420-dependent oxidoreductase
MDTHPFRFAVNLMPGPQRGDWLAKCRRAEDLGFDTLNVSDYLDRQSAFPALAVAAEATERIRVGTYVLNAGFYRPVLLARDVTTLYQLCGDRFELGVGAGFAKEEFEAAGVPWNTARERVDHLERTVKELRSLVPQPGPRMMIGGNGRAALSVAAAHADIVSMAGAHPRTSRKKSTPLDYNSLAELAAFARTAVGDRLSEVEFNILIHMVKPAPDRAAGLAFLGQIAPGLPEQDLARLPTLLAGSPESIAEDLRRCREELGFSYFTVLEPMMGDFAKVMELLR